MAKLTVHFRTVEEAMAATGTKTPRAALESLKDSGRMAKRGTYLAHVGNKQKFKERERARKKAETEGK